MNTRYDGTGGFPISSLGMRLAAALSDGDWNILLTSYLTPESRMMIHRKVTERVNSLAGFLLWDKDPYLVITDDGRLVWMLDGYMTSESPSLFAQRGHGRRRRLQLHSQFDQGHRRRLRWQRPSVRLRRGRSADAAYRNLFPDLFTPASAMPADLRPHTRSPEMMFRAQAEIYRTYHMRDPESYYNRADLWDLAKDLPPRAATPSPSVRPTWSPPSPATKTPSSC